MAALVTGEWFDIPADEIRQELTIHCAWCQWSFEGELHEARARAKQHRKEKHSGKAQKTTPAPTTCAHNQCGKKGRWRTPDDNYLCDTHQLEVLRNLHARRPNAVTPTRAITRGRKRRAA